MPLESLFGQLNSPLWITRECAVKTLEAQLRSPEHERWRNRFQHATFSLLCKDSYRLVRAAARHALEQDYIDAPLLRELVLNTLKQGGTKEKVRCLSLVPHLFKAPSAVDDLLLDFIDSESASLRKVAVKLAAQYSPQAIPRIVRRLFDQDRGVSEAAFYSLTEALDHVPPDIRALLMGILAHRQSWHDCAVFLQSQGYEITIPDLADATKVEKSDRQRVTKQISMIFQSCATHAVGS